MEVPDITAACCPVYTHVRQGWEEKEQKQNKKETKTKTKIKTPLTTMHICQNDTGAEFLMAKPHKQQNKVVLDYDPG